MTAHSRLNILCGAQEFGYGPISTLFKFIQQFKYYIPNSHVDCIATDTANTFLELNPNIIDTLINHVKIKDYDLVLGCFNAELIVEGFLNDIPTIYLTNLLWYWQPSSLENIKTLAGEVNFLKLEKQLNQARALIESTCKSHHDLMILGYLLADTVIVRTFPNIERKLQALEIQPKAKLYRSLTNSSNDPHPPPDNNIFIQLSGSVSPITDKDENLRYLDLIAKLFSALSKEHTIYNFIICANPKILKDYAHLNSCHNVQLISSLSIGKNLKTIQDSFAIFTSPGLETIFEATDANAPIFLLPEQSAGQYANVYFLKKSNFNPIHYLIDEEFPSRERGEGELDLHQLYKCITSMCQTDSKHFNELLQRARAFIHFLEEPHGRACFVKNQQDALNQFFASDSDLSLEGLFRWLTNRLPIYQSS